MPLPALTENHHELMRVASGEQSLLKITAGPSDGRCPICGSKTFVLVAVRRHRASMQCDTTQCPWELRVEIGEKK